MTGSGRGLNGTVRLAVGGAAAGLLLAIGLGVWGLSSHGGVAGSRGAPSEDSLLSLDRPILEELRARRLLLPVEGIARARLADSFLEGRSGGRRHQAVDILAARHTPVRAVEDGTVARLATSRAGGIAVYHVDPGRRYCYYYAHLEGYAPGLAEGQKVERGQVIGYVGTSGNAPETTPHLHFAIFRLSEPDRWWSGRAVNPFAVLR